MTNEIVDAEVVDEVAEHGTELAATFARPVVSPQQAVEAAEELRQLIARVLVNDKHYQRIRGRDVLLKAGAEELAKFFGLSTQYSELTTTTVEGVFQASVKCTVSKAGLALAESYGFYDSTERRNATPNTVVKMAQKRAYVGAVMSATGTSELFTQDLDDNDATAGPAPAADRMSSLQEKNALVELYARKSGEGMVAAGVWLKEKGERGDSFAWVATTAMALLLKPDSPPRNSGETETVATKVEPELPAEPSPAEVQAAARSYRIEMPAREGKGEGFVAAVEVSDDHVIVAAPIMQWSMGMPIARVAEWVSKNGGEMRVLD